MGLISLLISLIIAGAILYVVWWAINRLPIPEPIRTVVNVVFVLIVLVIALKLLLPMTNISIGL